MGVEDMFSGCKKIFVLIALAALLAGFIGDFITTITWWSRIQPWFGHGYEDGKKVYQCILACWVLSLVGAILTAFFLLATLCIKSVCGSITGNKIALALCFIIVGLISVGSIISGGLGSSYALTNPKISKVEDDYKCSRYLSQGYFGAWEWVGKHPDKAKDFANWQKKFLKHVQDEDENFKGYLCRDVGAPTMTFVLVQCAAIILWLVIIIMALIC